MYLEWSLNTLSTFNIQCLQPRLTQSVEVCWVNGEEEDPKVHLLRALALENCQTLRWIFVAFIKHSWKTGVEKTVTLD